MPFTESSIPYAGSHEAATARAPDILNLCIAKALSGDGTRAVTVVAPQPTAAREEPQPGGS
ncbi:MAG: hypothetical protein OXC98_09210 [bacterium]|nr:hypothetical protein [Acidimicrobiia bacterium]MCY4650527.1 hypothetical protein [bacterium]